MNAVILQVSDLDRAARLYREAFGVDLSVSDHEGGEHGHDDPWTSGRHAEISWRGGVYLHFALYERREATSHAQVSFRVDDIERAHARAVAAGAQVLHEPRTEPWGTSARYRDHDGNTVELTQPS